MALLLPRNMLMLLFFDIGGLLDSAALKSAALALKALGGPAAEASLASLDDSARPVLALCLTHVCMHTRALTHTHARSLARMHTHERTNAHILARTIARLGRTQVLVLGRLPYDVLANLGARQQAHTCTPA